MITYLEVYPLLTAACATYASSKEATRANEGDGEFVRVGHFVGHLIERLASGETHDFPAVFGVVEWVLEEGDDEARMVVTDGFFHDLVNPTFYSGTAAQPRDFVRWFGPHARLVPAVQRLL